MLEITDPDNVFFPGDGLVGGTPASFTAPADGTYLIVWQFRAAGTTFKTFNRITPATIYRESINLASAGARNTFYDMFIMTSSDTVTCAITGDFNVRPFGVSITGPSGGVTLSYIRGYSIN